MTIHDATYINRAVTKDDTKITIMVKSWALNLAMRSLIAASNMAILIVIRWGRPIIALSYLNFPLGAV